MRPRPVAARSSVGHMVQDETSDFEVRVVVEDFADGDGENRRLL